MPIQNDEATLYHRLGGEHGVERLLVDFYGNVLEDRELAPFFENISMDKLIEMQRELFSSALDGPHTYSGRPLKEVHAGLGITLHHFQRFREHLLTTLKDAGVSADDMHDVIHRVTKLKKDILS